MSQTPADPINNLFPITPEIGVFLNSCLWDKGMRDLPPDLHESMVQNLYLRLERWLLADIAMRLSKKDVEVLNTLQGTAKDPEEIAKFFKKNIPDFDGVYASSMDNFKQTFLAG